MSTEDLRSRTTSGGPLAAPSDAVQTPAPEPRQTRGADASGIILLLGALAMLTLMDATAKHLNAQYHVSQVIWARFAINLAILLLLFRGRIVPNFRSRQPLSQIGRGTMQVVTISLFLLSLQTVGLAEAESLFILNPVLITLGAFVFLKERIGPRRIAAIAVAFLGAMIVLRPGTGAVQPAALLALASAFSYAAGNLLTRSIRHDAFATSLLWGAAIGTALTSLVLPFHWKEVAPADLPWFLAVGIFGTLGQALAIRAFARSEAAALAPFGYFELILAGIWGWLFFHEIPDRFTVLGALVIAGAGLYVWYRERKSA